MIVEIPYNRDRAVEYAKKWALSRNPLFLNFMGIGGDCTNFVSQCVFAGCGVMNFTETFGWYYISPENRAPAWSGVDEFYNFMTGLPEFTMANGGIGPYGREARTATEVEIGDVIQLRNPEGEFYHTLIITGFEGGDVLVSAHTNDALDRRLSSYSYLSLRVIHILGARLDIDNTQSFERIFNGEAIESL